MHKYGDHRPNPERFPDFNGLVKKLHNNGQRVSLHWVPYMIATDFSEELSELRDFLMYPASNDAVKKYLLSFPAILSKVQ